MDFDGGKLFVGGISHKITEETLLEHFRQYGEIIDCVVMRDSDSGRSRRFGFVQFSDSSAATKALQDKHVLLQRKVDVKKAEPRRQRHQNLSYQKQNGGLNTEDGANDQLMSNKIFVGGLSPAVTEDDFKTYFDEYGTIIDVVVMHDGLTGRPRGFGFITFDSEEAAGKALRKRFHTLKDKQVEVKKALPKVDTKHNYSYNSHRRNNYNMRGDEKSDYQCNPHYGFFYYMPMPFFPGYVYGGSYPFGSYNGVPFVDASKNPSNDAALPFSTENFVTYENGVIYPYYINYGVGGGVTNAIDRDCHEIIESVNNNEQNGDGVSVHMLADTQVDAEDNNTDYSSSIENYNDPNKQILTRVEEQLNSLTIGNLD